MFYEAVTKVIRSVAEGGGVEKYVQFGALFLFFMIRGRLRYYGFYAYVFFDCTAISRAISQLFFANTEGTESTENAVSPFEKFRLFHNLRSRKKVSIISNDLFLRIKKF